MSDKLRNFLKGFHRWVMKPAIVILGLILIAMLDDRWMNRGNSWQEACAAIFGRNILSNDILLFLGPLGLVFLGLLAAGICLFRLLCKKRIPSFPLTAVSLWGFLTVLAWEFDWIQQGKKLFLSWVPGLSIAVVILLDLVFLVLLLLALSVGKTQEEHQKASRNAGIAGYLLLRLLLLALSVGAALLVRYAVVLAFSGKPAGYVILAGLLLLCVPGMVSSWKKGRKEKEEAAAPAEHGSAEEVAGEEFGGSREHLQ